MNIKTIKTSKYANALGGLKLITANDKYYLSMGNGYGVTYHGPLSDSDVVAFERICRIPAVGSLEEYKE